MNGSVSLPFNASLDEYQEQAKRLFELVKSGDVKAEWRFKWMHPDFRGKSDTIYQGTPLGWAIHCEKPKIAEYLRAEDAPES